MIATSVPEGQSPDAAVNAALGEAVFKPAAEFREWLRANATALSRGGALYRGRWVTSGTRTRQLTLCVSMLIVGFRLPSRPFIEGADRIGGRTFVYTVVTLLLGWWSIHGLFWTPGALLGNLRGGRESTVGAALATMGPP